MIPENAVADENPGCRKIRNGFCMEQKINNR